jgi:hypothetical protein
LKAAVVTVRLGSSLPSSCPVRDATMRTRFSSRVWRSRLPVEQIVTDAATPSGARGVISWPYLQSKVLTRPPVSIRLRLRPSAEKVAASIGPAPLPAGSWTVPRSPLSSGTIVAG